MKSTIKIDVDGEGFPYIHVKLSQDTSDLRDKSLKRFIENRGTESSLLGINCYPSNDSGSEYAIYPIREVVNYEYVNSAEYPTEYPTRRNWDPNKYPVEHLWYLIGLSLGLRQSDVAKDIYTDGVREFNLTRFGFELIPNAKETTNSNRILEDLKSGDSMLKGS